MSSKLTGLPTVSSAATVDLLYIVTDPGGTPASNAVTYGNLASQLVIDGYSQKWSEATADLTMSINNAYTTNQGSLLTYTLPVTCPVGATFEIAGKSVSGWLIAQQSGQTIYGLATPTTTGATGSLASFTQYDTVKLVCITADTDFVVLSGNNLATLVIV